MSDTSASCFTPEEIRTIFQEAGCLPPTTDQKLDRLISAFKKLAKSHSDLADRVYKLEENISKLSEEPKPAYIFSDAAKKRHEKVQDICNDIRSGKIPMLTGIHFDDFELAELRSAIIHHEFEFNYLKEQIESRKK